MNWTWSVRKCGAHSVAALVFVSASSAGLPPPVFPEREWQECAPEAQGVDAAKLAAAVDYLAANSGADRNRELVIVRNGWMIFRGDNVDHVHGIWSCTKSFTSTMLGLLVADGKCTPDTNAAGILPELKEHYAGVTLRHFATMTSGYKAMGDDAAGGHGQSKTPFAPAPAMSAPGEKFTYWDSAMNKFAEALTVLAGEPLQDLFKRRIADPIGMNPAQWRWGNRGQQRGSVINGGAGNGNGHVFTSARELARLGLLFLNDGRWNGRQIVDSDWVREVTRAHVGSYGMNWWSNGIQTDGTRKWPHAPASAFAALGHNNNHLFVIPEWGMVIVRLGLDQKDVKMSDETWSEFFNRLGPALNRAPSAGSPPLPSGAVSGSSPVPAARPSVALPPRTFAIGKGGTDGFMTVDARGTIHAVYGGKYRTGNSPDKLGPDEAITAIAPFNGVRVAVDSAGQPHVVFTDGATANAKRSYYTARIGGRWIPPEKFADADELRDRGRAYVADVAVNETGHALVSFWVGRPTERRSEYEDWSFYYRWRSAAGAWSEPRSLPAHWSSAAKVEYEPRRGFLLLWQHRSVDWRIAGPVAAGGNFALEGSIPTGSATLGSAVQNEGADFSMHPTGALVVAGNKREKFEGPVGVWATVGTREVLPPPAYLGSFPDTKRGSESGLHPVTAFDAETGHAFVCVLDAGTKRAVFTVHRPERGWVTHYTPILPAHPTPQGTLRQGPSIADTPGPGVLALVRGADQQWYIRHLLPEDAVAASAGN